ncbi:MAG TPA: hypothetical protein VMT62_07450 [Syntrophorhabdaceae bacterium]|nr:hypothetical protein [Syntrophorhabdaceae bacterium]
MDREIHTFLEFHESLFESFHWCPIYGKIPWFNYEPNSSIYQCCDLIQRARSLLERENYFYMNPPIDFVYSPQPCKACEHRSSCTGLPYCETWSKWEREQRAMYEYFPPEFTEGERVNLRSARAILHNSYAIEDHTLWWSNNDLDNVAKYGDHEKHDLASVYERAIEKTKDLATYFEEGSSWTIDEDTDDVFILTILAISKAWGVLKTIGYSGDDLDAQKNTRTAEKLLFKAHELAEKRILEDIENERHKKSEEMSAKELEVTLLDQRNAELSKIADRVEKKKQTRAKQLEKARKIKIKKHKESKEAATQLAQSMAVDIWHRERKDGYKASNNRKTASEIKRKISGTVRSNTEKKIEVTPAESYLEKYSVPHIARLIKKPDVRANQAIRRLWNKA